MARLFHRGALIALVAFPLTALTTGLPVGAAATGTRSASAGVRLVAVRYRPACEAHRGGTHGRCGGGAAQLDGEWVELANTGGAVRMAGWTITEGRHHHLYRFGRFTFAHGALARIHVGPGRNGIHDLYWGMRTDAFSDHGDTLTLRSASGTVVRRFHYLGGGSIAWVPGYRASGAGPWGSGTGVRCPGWSQPLHGGGGMMPYGPMGAMGGFGGPTGQPPSTPTTSPSAATFAPATVVHVRIENVKTPEGTEPAFVGPRGKLGVQRLLSVKAHAEVEVVVDSHDSGPHSFTSPSLGLDVAIAPKATVTFRFRAPGPGVYPWYCDIPCGSWVMSHAGYMKGEVTVVS